MKIKSLINKFFSIFWGNTYSAVLNITIAAIFVSKTGLEAYGKLVLLQSIYYAWSYVSKPQTWQALVKFSPLYGINQTAQATLKIESEAIKFSGVTFVILAVILENTYSESFSSIEYFLFFIASLSLNQGTTIGYLRYTSKFNLLSFINSLLATAKLISCLLVQDVLLYFKITLLIDLIIWTTVSISTIKSINLNSHLSIKQKKEISSFSWWGTLNLALDLPVSHLDKIIISHYLGLEAAAAVNLIRRISLAIGQISDPIYHIILQKFTHLLNEQKRNEAWKIGTRIAISTAVVAIVASTISTQFFELIDKLLFSKNLHGYETIFTGYLLTYFLGLAFVWIHPFFIIEGHMQKNAILLFTANSIYISLLILLSSYGAWGALLAFTTQVALSIIPKIVYLKVQESSK